MTAFQKGDRVAIRSRGLNEIAVYGRTREGTVQRVMPGGQYVVVDLDDPSDRWGARMVTPDLLERIDR